MPPRRSPLRTSPRRPPRARAEHGALLVLTAALMTTFLAATAFAVDIARRNEMLAASQHAIDAGVITAAEYLSRHDADYAGANARLTAVVEADLGIARSKWEHCTDDGALPITAPDTGCISYRRNADGRRVTYDIRVRLPELRLTTMFGSALGIDSIDLAAGAASNGVNCVVGAAVNCAAPPTGGPATTTTTIDPATGPCAALGAPLFVIHPDTWVRCRSERPDVDIEALTVQMCNEDVVDFFWPLYGHWDAWTFDGRYRYSWYWSTCETRSDPAIREAWMIRVCATGDLAYIYSAYHVWLECSKRTPGMESFDRYNATTTTTSVGATTTIPGSGVPTSIDING